MKVLNKKYCCLSILSVFIVAVATNLIIYLSFWRPLSNEITVTNCTVVSCSSNCDYDNVCFEIMIYEIPHTNMTARYVFNFGDFSSCQNYYNQGYVTCYYFVNDIYSVDINDPGNNQYYIYGLLMVLIPLLLALCLCCMYTQGYLSKDVGLAVNGHTHLLESVIPIEEKVQI
jgi:hypothetical protein